MLRCRHCCVNASLAGRGSEMRLMEITGMLDRAVDYRMDLLEISGGEPLTRGKELLLEGLKHASEEGLLTSLNTNAYNLSREYASKLAEVGLDRAKLSLYGVSPGSHDEFTRVTGSFHRVIHGIKALKRAGLEVWVHYIVTPKNIRETEVLPSLLDPLQVDVVQFGSVIPSGRGVNAENYVFEEEELTDITHMLENCFSDAFSSGQYSFTTSLYPPSQEGPFEERFCDYFARTLVVDPVGDVIPCCILPRRLKSKLGTVKEESFHEVFSFQRIMSDPVHYWLWKGHKAMREKLGIERRRTNLCSLCIDMLNKLQDEWSKKRVNTY